ncbi:TPA: hypothetical protein G9F27_002291 [Salmonella enterica]|uniref:Chemotaxis protein n=1 Tax=Salmonella enterica TaxID=28901 RepID=A0A743P438_SALER|nr:hypothetical protein [Salmonella enterica]
MNIFSDLMALHEENHLADERLTTLINHFWSMRGRLNNKLTAEGAAGTISEKRYKRLLTALLDELIRESVDIQNTTRQSGWVLKTLDDRLHISLLRALHIQWCNHARIYALNQAGNSPEKTFPENPVSDWYKNAGKTQFAHLPAFSPLGDALNRFQAATEALRLEGRYRMSPDSLSEKLQLFDAACQSVTGALGGLDEQINTMADLARIN